MEIVSRSVIMLEVPGTREEQMDSPFYWDYAPVKAEPATLNFIPYFAWANRGEGEMRVWVRTV